MTLKDAVDAYLLAQAWRVKDLPQRAHWVRAFEKYRGPNTRLEEIGRADAEGYLAELQRRGLAPNTIRGALAYASHLMAEAKRHGLITENPFSGLRRPRATWRERFLTEEEARQLLQESPAWLRRILTFGLETGLRPGELRGLRKGWADEDLLRLPAEKTKAKRARAIPLTALAKEILRSPPTELNDGFLFGDARGRPIQKGQLRRGFANACKRAGITGVTPHTLRHTVASWLVQRGVPLYTVGVFLGHSSPETTKRYAHLSSDYLREAIKALEINGK